MASLFRNYLIVDWSAASTPKTGPDSVWYAWIERHRDGRWVYQSSNPATRRQAAAEIRAKLLESVKQSRATLATFDFPLGYPRGAGPWQDMWRAIASGVRDDAENRNNRFDVAAKLNRKLKGAFWGRPVSQPVAGLSLRRPAAAARLLPEMRYTDARVAGPQSPWKLYGAGSAGGQALTGIPYLWRLREDPELSPYVRVWPFETGLAAPFGAQQDEPRIVFAEAWPSQLRPKPRPDEVKDQMQVRVMAEHFARLDQAGRLARLFAGPRELSGEQRRAIEREEGWILGLL